MSGFETRGRRNHGPKAPDLSFVIATAILAVAMIGLSIAVGVPTPPELAIFMG